MQKQEIENLKATLDCDDGFLAELMEKFIEESDEMIGKIKDAFKNGNRTALRQLAHKMLSSTRILDLADLSDSLETVELHAEDPQMQASVGELVNELEVRQKQIVDDLQETIRQLKTQ